MRVAEASFNPLPPPPPAPTAEHVKKEMSKTAVDEDIAAHPDDVKLDENGDPVVDSEGDGEDGGAGVKGTVVKTGKKTILGALRLGAKKAATFKADVSVDGAKQKVSTRCYVLTRALTDTLDRRSATSWIACSIRAERKIQRRPSVRR